MPTRTPIIVPRKFKLDKQQEQQQLHQEKNCELTLCLIKVGQLEMINEYGYECYRIYRKLSKDKLRKCSATESNQNTHNPVVEKEHLNIYSIKI